MSLVNTVFKKFNIPSQYAPYICVFLIAKTNTLLLIGFTFFYILLQRQNEQKKIEFSTAAVLAIAPPPTTTAVLTIVPPSPTTAATITIAPTSPTLLYDIGNRQRIRSTTSSYYSEMNTTVFDRRLMSSSSIEFDHNISTFPACPTTLPRLDAHFNFVAKHASDTIIYSPGLSTPVGWPSFQQEMEYEHQRIFSDNRSSIIKQHRNSQYFNLHHQKELSSPSHPLLFLHQLQQDSQSMIFSEDDQESLLSSVNHDSSLSSESEQDFLQLQQDQEEEERALLDYAYINNNRMSQSIMLLPTYSSISTNDDDLNSIRITDTTVLRAFNDIEDLTMTASHFSLSKIMRFPSITSLNIEEVLLMPPLVLPTKPSPSKLFKSKFQKAVSKIKKSTTTTIVDSKRSKDNELEEWEEDNEDQRFFSMFSGFPEDNEKPDLIPAIDSHFQKEPIFNSTSAVSPRTSVSTRIQDHLKGRFNRLFYKK